MSIRRALEGLQGIGFRARVWGLGFRARVYCFGCRV